ncbi:MAG: hypothetical protein NTV34_18085, partial [Proteobacteria bacterium]|nr:hypothetical protein [Pseudomonadota bacterium]
DSALVIFLGTRDGHCWCDFLSQKVGSILTMKMRLVSIQRIFGTSAGSFRSIIGPVSTNAFDVIKR